MSFNAAGVPDGMPLAEEDFDEAEAQAELARIRAARLKNKPASSGAALLAAEQSLQGVYTAASSTCSEWGKHAALTSPQLPRRQACSAACLRAASLLAAVAEPGQQAPLLP